MSPEDSGHPDLSELIVRAVAAPLFVLDWRGMVTIWNQRMSTLTGISGAEIEGRCAAESCLLPEDRHRWRRQLQELSAVIPRSAFVARWKTASGSFDQMQCECVLTNVQDAQPGSIVCTLSTADTLPEAGLRERAAESGDYAHYLHQTLAQDLVQLSFCVESLSGMEAGSLPQSGYNQARDLIERCCSAVRVMMALFAPLPRGASFGHWLQDYAAFFRAETGLVIELDVDPPPADISESVTGLFATAIQIWIARITRTPSASAVRIRLRERDVMWTLEIDCRDVPVERFLIGWSLVQKRAEQLGGAFRAVQNQTGAIATLQLPFSVGTGSSV